MPDATAEKLNIILRTPRDPGQQLATVANFCKERLKVAAEADARVAP